MDLTGYLDYVLNQRKALKAWVKENIKIVDWKAARKVIDRMEPPGLYLAKEEFAWLAVYCPKKDEVFDTSLPHKWEAIMWLYKMANQ